MTRWLGGTAAALTLVLAGGCGADEDPATGTEAPATPEKVTFLTGLNVQGREAYVYVAMEKGYFKEAGLEVEVKPGLGTNQNLKLLQGGQVDYAVVDITGALMEYGKGAFKDFTIVSAIQQRNLACLMALEGDGVTGPKDLEGKKIAYIPGGVVRTLFDTYANLAGVDAKKVQWVNMPAPQMPQALAAGRIDVATQFVVGKPFVENVAKPRKAVMIPYSDYLVDLYGNGVAVTKKTLKDDGDQVKRFNDALLKGLAYAVDNPKEAAKIYAKFQKLQPEPVAAAEMTLMAPYVKSSATGTRVGGLDAKRMARNIAILQGAGAIPTSFSPEDVVSFDHLPST
ncbi:MAG TPA: ABC transporter substrate-binding protein [Pilimelia sp.]|nr:ABC transporter substrate-binding protein [Pilimelia sp.]